MNAIQSTRQKDEWQLQNKYLPSEVSCAFVFDPCQQNWRPNRDGLFVDSMQVFMQEQEAMPF